MLSNGLPVMVAVVVDKNNDRAEIFSPLKFSTNNQSESEKMGEKSVQITLTSPDHIYLGKKKDAVRLLCLDLTNYNRMVQFFLCSAAVFLFYLVYGYMQVRESVSEGLKQ